MWIWWQRVTGKVVINALLAIEAIWVIEAIEVREDLEVQHMEHEVHEDIEVTQGVAVIEVSKAGKGNKAAEVHPGIELLLVVLQGIVATGSIHSFQQLWYFIGM
jgi:hypothetical protein